MHDLKGLGLIPVEYFAEPWEDRLGERGQGEGLDGVGDLFRDGIEPGQRVIGFSKVLKLPIRENISQTEEGVKNVLLGVLSNLLIYFPYSIV